MQFWSHMDPMGYPHGWFPRRLDDFEVQLGNSGYRKTTGPQWPSSRIHTWEDVGKIIMERFRTQKKRTYTPVLPNMAIKNLPPFFFGMYKKNTGIFQCHVSSEWSLFPCESNEVTEGSRKLQVFFTKVKRYGETSPKKCWHNHEITMIVMDSKPPLHKRKTHTSHCSVIEEQHLYKPNPGFAIITWNNPRKIGETLHHQGTCYLSIFRMDFPM